jgi:hypothetical protein
MFIWMINTSTALYSSLIARYQNFKLTLKGLKYKQSLATTNRDARGFVDFEKVQGIKGIALMNEILNLDDVKKGMPRELVTKFTTNDGEEWKNLKAPDGKTLHLHAFTQRHDQKDLYSSATAIGMMIGVGSVGEHLLNYNDCQTYVSRDAGESWKSVATDAYMFEIGNRGSIILLVNDEAPTDFIKYFSSRLILKVLSRSRHHV